MKLEFHERAETDVVDAWSYYEKQQAGLGTKFLSVLDATLQKVLRNPQHYSFIDTTQTIRDVVLPVFSFYTVVFEVVGEVVLILRVFHTAQRPESL